MELKESLKPNKIKLLFMIPNILTALLLGPVAYALIAIFIPPLQIISFPYCYILLVTLVIVADYFVSIFTYQQYISSNDKRRSIINGAIIYGILYSVVILGFLFAKRLTW